MTAQKENENKGEATQTIAKIGAFFVNAKAEETAFVYAPIDEENNEEENIDWTWNQIDDLLAQSKIIKNWEPEEGMGSVFLAKHPDLGFIVATKQEEGQDVVITCYGAEAQAKQLYDETKTETKQGRVYWK